MSSSCHWAVSSGSGHVGAHVGGRPAARDTLLSHHPTAGRCTRPGTRATGLRLLGASAVCHAGVAGFPDSACPTGRHRLTPPRHPFPRLPTSACPSAHWVPGGVPGDQRGRSLVPLPQSDISSCPAPFRVRSPVSPWLGHSRFIRSVPSEGSAASGAVRGAGPPAARAALQSHTRNRSHRRSRQTCKTAPRPPASIGVQNAGGTGKSHPQEAAKRHVCGKRRARRPWRESHDARANQDHRPRGPGSVTTRPAGGSPNAPSRTRGDRKQGSKLLARDARKNKP